MIENLAYWKTYRFRSILSHPLYSFQNDYFKSGDNKRPNLEEINSSNIWWIVFCLRYMSSSCLLSFSLYFFKLINSVQLWSILPQIILCSMQVNSRLFFFKSRAKTVFSLVHLLFTLKTLEHLPEYREHNSFCFMIHEDLAQLLTESTFLSESGVWFSYEYP